jgi:YQGE family putative transporter
MILIAAYNLSVFLTIPVGFYLNGFLLKKFQTNKLYCFGIITQAFIIALLIFLPETTIIAIIVFGLLYGIAMGMYWANRNLLTLRSTHSDNRIYFSGLETILNRISEIIAPIMIGFFITSGSFFSLYTPLIAYKILAIFMILISLLIGYSTMNMQTPREDNVTLWLHNAPKQWQKFRWYEIYVGFISGIETLLPVLMIFVLVGEENSLGTIQSISAILSALVVYEIAKKLKIQQRVLLVLISTSISILGAISFSFFYSAIVVFIFFVAIEIASPILYIALSSLNYDLIDKKETSAHHYAYICDQELYLNGGRVVAMILFLYLIHTYSNTFALRFMPIAYAMVQLLVFFVAKTTEKEE